MSFIYISNLFQEPLIRNYNLRNADFVIPRFCTTKYGKHSVSYLGPIIWSKLSANTRSIETLNQFKKDIRTQDLSNLLENNCRNCHLCTS